MTFSTLPFFVRQMYGEDYHDISLISEKDLRVGERLISHKSRWANGKRIVDCWILYNYRTKGK